MQRTGWPLILVAVLLAIGPAQAADWKSETRELIDARQYQKAAAVLDKNQAEAATPDFLCLRGELYFETGRVLDAQADAEKALAQADNRADGHALLALVFAKQRAIAAARPHAEKAVELEKKARWLYVRSIIRMSDGRLDEALADLTEAIRQDGGQSDFYLARGAVARFREKHPDALADFDKALSRDKRPYKAHIERATTFVMMGDPVQAKSEAQKAVDVAPELYHGYLGRGFVRQQYKDVDGALADFTKAISLAPQLAELHFAKSNLLVGLGRYQEARTTLEAAKSACADIPDWYVMYSLVQGTLKDFDGALATLNELIQKTPKRWEGYNLRGQLYASRNQLDLAIADFDQAATLSSKAIEPRLNKFALLAALKKTDEALAVLNQVLADNPDNLMALQMRMKFYEALGRNADALKDLERIEQLKKKDQAPPP